MIYVVGLAGVTAVNAAPSLAPRFHAPPASGAMGPTRGLFWAAMYLIALGKASLRPPAELFARGSCGLVCEPAVAAAGARSLGLEGLFWLA
jgi:hypothetical protein